MAKRYLCVHCDYRFEHGGDDRPRCPKCMRQNGLEELGEVKSATPARRPRWIAAGVLGVLAVVGVAYAVWAASQPQQVSGEPPLRPLTEGELQGYLRNADVDAGDLAGLLGSDAAVERIAEGVASARDPRAKADGVVEALQARARAQAFVHWSLTAPRDTDVLTAPSVAAKLAEDGARAHLYPLEVAAVAVAALRDAGVPAMLAEIWSFPGDRSPPDPGGHFGYFGVAVYPGPPGEGEPAILDPYGGHATEPGREGYRVLTDPQAVAAALSLRALYALVHENDASRGLRLADAALRLDPRAPYARGVRASAVLVSGGIPDGVAELEAAAQLRPDAPRHNNLAGVYMATGELDRASREVAAALDQHADFAGAHATLAAILLGQGDLPRARTELVEAERLDPDLFTLDMIWAEYFMRMGDAPAAVRRAEAAVAARPHDLQIHLQAAQVMRAAGNYDAMRRLAREAVDLAPADRKPMVEQRILEVLGPTALEAPELDGEDLAAWEAELLDSAPQGEVALPEPELDLSQSSSLLGDDAPSVAPSGGLELGGSGPGGPGGPSLLMGDPSHFRLGGQDQDLHLQLAE